MKIRQLGINSFQGINATLLNSHVCMWSGGLVILHDPHTVQYVYHLSLPDKTANNCQILMWWRTAACVNIKAPQLSSLRRHDVKMKTSVDLQTVLFCLNWLGGELGTKLREAIIQVQMWQTMVYIQFWHFSFWSFIVWVIMLIIMSFE